MCVTSLCTRGALDAWSRGRSTAALCDSDAVSFVSGLPDRAAMSDVMTIAVELWARGLGMLAGGYWFVLVPVVVAGVFCLFVRGKRVLGAACLVVSLVAAPYVQIFIWNAQTSATRVWLGDWTGNFGASNVRIDFQSASANTISGRLFSGNCHPGGEIVAVVDGGDVTIATIDAQVFASLSGDAAAITGTVTGCSDQRRTESAELIRTGNQ